MKGEIITIGNELLSGLVVDTNRSYVAGRLMTAGVIPSFMTTVGDDEGAIADAVTRAVERARVIVVTGGLGPTPDDITSKSIARALEKRLILDPSAERQIQARYKKRGINPPADASRQALIPHGGRVIVNPIGTAPGYYLVVGDKIVFVLPGVPEEMRVMVDQGVLSILETQGDADVYIVRRILRIFGMTESQVNERVKDVAYDGRRVTVGFLPIFPENHLTVTAHSSVSKNDADQIAQETADAMRAALGDRVFGRDDQTLEAVVGGMLITRGYTVAAAESCTGGLLAQRLTAIPGSSSYFLRGVVAYSNDSKTGLLGIDPALIAEFGAVSGEVASAMARGIKESSSADLGISITGVAGPSGGTKGKPVGTVFIGMAFDDGGTCSVRSHGYRFYGDRGRIRLISSEMALEWIRRYLIRGPSKNGEM
ncbi:MAG: competence/damage-inducible protein A [Deltaproteobacteria bacterium]|nr:competence/damage-inducible protein A [Candidatus Zymogenaceae bacterium]